MRGTSSLGTYLRERRTRLDPARLGYGGRRRTPGLRREEVAQRAGISATWYSWLEQGRGGPPSAHALERLASALMLTSVEREHLFLLALGHPPEVRYRPVGEVAPRFQRMLDALDASPAIIRTATWDVVAWNRAAAAILTDYDAVPATERNILRLLFLDPETRAANAEWADIARSVVGAFRGDAARTGSLDTVQPLVNELRARSAEFEAMWLDSNVLGPCEGMKRLHHPVLGQIALEFAAFAIDGQPDLTMLVYTALSAEDASRIRSLAAAHAPDRAAVCVTHGT